MMNIGKYLSILIKFRYFRFKRGKFLDAFDPKYLLWRLRGSCETRAQESNPGDSSTAL